MELLKLTKSVIDDLKNKLIICFEKSSYLEEFYDKYKLPVYAVIDNNVKKHGEIMLGNTVVKVVGSEYLNTIDLDNCEIIITGDYYRESFQYLSGIDILNYQKRIYYFANKETEAEEEYREKYRDHELENIIIFRSGPHITSYIKGMDFADNAKALFEYMLEHGYNEKYELIWFVKNPDEFARYNQYKNVSFVALEWSLSDDKTKRDRYYRALCLAKYIFFTDAYGIARNARKDQIRVQLWHGCGFKTRLNFTPCRDRYEYMTVTGDVYARIHEELFGLNSNQLLVTGNAKVDWLFTDKTDDYFEMLGIKSSNKYIFWLPTFRQGADILNQNNGYELNGETGLPVVDSDSKMEALNKLLSDNDIMLIIKLHPFQKRELVKQKSLSNIVFLDNYRLNELGLHINQLLGKANALISDYSSVAVDFLALNRPMAFVLEDIDKYEVKRGFVFEDIVGNMPGFEIYSFNDFYNFVEEISKETDSTRLKRERLCKGMVKHMDGNNCRRIADALGIENYFDNCISLGWFCGTASSMSAHGLRGFSGPFDWYFSDLDSVLKVMNNDFTDFMLKENLQIAEDEPKTFIDKKYGFCCNHDINTDFEQEYPEIYERYHQRAIRFMNEVKRRTCFIRAVRSEKEISYIRQNRDYIYRVIKKSNPDNEIIFLLHNGMTELTDDFLWFKLNIDKYIGEAYEMRTMFDSSEKLIKYCQNSILSLEIMHKNILYDRKTLTRGSKTALIMHRLKEADISIAAALKDYFSDIDRGIYLWGSGSYGMRMLDYMKSQGIKVIAVIDNDDKKIGTMLNGVSVISFSDINDKCMNFFIAVSSETSVNSIVEQINNKYSSAVILTLDELYGYPMLPSLSWQ